MHLRFKTFLYVLLSATIGSGDPDSDPHDHDHDHGATPATQRSEHDHHDHDHDEHEHSDEVKLSPEAIKRHRITIANVSRRQIASSLVAPGRVSFNTETMAHIGSTVPGRVAEIRAKVGDAVTEGQELMIIDSPELGEAQSDYLQKRSAATVARAGVQPVSSSHERARKLYDETQGVALAEVQRREAELRSAEGAALAAELAASAARNKLLLMTMSPEDVKKLEDDGKLQPRYVVRAPVPGSVIAREVTLGEWVAPERDSLLVLADTSSLWVIADVPEARLGEVAAGAAARVEVAAVSGQSFEGAVTQIAPALNADTRTAAVRVVVPNEQGLLRPGMFARAEIQVGGKTAEGSAPLVVPEEAVQTIEGKPAVFVPVPGEENTFKPQALTLGKPGGGFIPVLEGLAEGQQFVASGSFILKAELGKGGASHGHDH